MTKERLHYIDVAKGLLILMVIWGHYELMCRLCFGINDPTINHLDQLEDFWVSFFMPAFFFLTGYCTNFDKRFVPFFTQGVKILIIPTVVINYTVNIIDYISWGESPIWIVKTTIKSFLLTCAGEWFIPSLFLSRLAVYSLARLRNTVVQLVIAITMLFAGAVLYDYFPQVMEIWYYKHALMVIIFMLMGNILKKNKLQMRLSVVLIYFPLFVVVMLYGNGVPYITNRVCVELWQLPIVLALAFSGISFIIFLSRKINNNRLFEYFGRNSLVIYLAHFIFYNIYLGMVAEYFNISPLISTALFFGVIIINVASCCLLAMALNTKYLKWILGKF